MLKQFIAKYNKKLIALAMFFILITPLSLSADILSGDKRDEFQNNVDKLALDTGYSTEDTIEARIGTIVRVVLSIIGSIFLLFTVLAGFKWMRAGGNQETVKKAQDQIKSLIIGLIIVLAAYALSYWIVDIFAQTLSD